MRKAVADLVCSGLPYSYGVFEKYYSDHEKFSDESGIAAIGTVGMVGIASFMVMDLLTDKSLGHCLLLFSADTDVLAKVAISSKGCLHCWTIYHRGIPDHSVFLSECYISGYHARTFIWAWRGITLQPLHFLSRRMVHKT